MDKLKIIKYHENWPGMTYTHSGDAGLDCFLPEEVVLQPGVNKVPLGFGIILDPGMMAQIIERSSNAMAGLIFAKAPIDRGYTGQIHAIVFNLTDREVVFHKGERLGQLVITQIVNTAYTEDYSDRIPHTERGSNGFGSTGK